MLIARSGIPSYFFFSHCGRFLLLLVLGPSQDSPSLLNVARFVSLIEFREPRNSTHLQSVQFAVVTFLHIEVRDGELYAVAGWNLDLPDALAIVWVRVRVLRAGERTRLSPQSTAATCANKAVPVRVACHPTPSCDFNNTFKAQTESSSVPLTMYSSLKPSCDSEASDTKWTYRKRDDVISGGGSRSVPQ